MTELAGRAVVIGSALVARDTGAIQSNRTASYEDPSCGYGARRVMRSGDDLESNLRNGETTTDLLRQLV